MILTKQDVARRQLVTAIRLFYDDRDEVSVFTLASNAWEIIDVLCHKNSINSLSKQTDEHAGKNKSIKYDYINKPYRSYFKHADRDWNKSLEGFSDENNDHILILAVEDLIRLNKKLPIECQIYQLWYLAIYEDKIAEDVYDDLMATIKSEFPNILDLSRKKRKNMGKEKIIEFIKNHELINDPRTEKSELERWS